MNRYSRYEDSDVEILQGGGRAVVKRKGARSYHEVSSATLPQDLRWEPALPGVSRRFATAYFVILGVLLPSHIAFALALTPDYSTDVTGASWWLLGGYTLAQLLIHEAGHIVAFRALGRRPDKVGVKLNYAVFPAVYVRMNDTHMLLRDEKLVVHTAGLVANSILGWLVLAGNKVILRSDTMDLAVSIFGVGLLMNALPVLKSDGHKALMALLQINVRKQFSRNGRLVRLLHIASWCLAIVMTARTASLLLPG
ncbi:hypothetical protein [Cellulomonas sp. Marseille-Q8402]